MSDQPKPFESNIPEHLLQSETQGMQYLMKELSKNTQATEYLLRKREESGVKLDEISNKLKGVDDKVSEVDNKLKFTNGKIGNALIQIKALEDKNSEGKELELEIKQIVKIKKITFGLATSKLFWGCSAVVLFFGINTGFFAGIIRWALGLVELG